MSPEYTAGIWSWDDRCFDCHSITAKDKGEAREMADELVKQARQPARLYMLIRDKKKEGLEK